MDKSDQQFFILTILAIIAIALMAWVSFIYGAGHS